MLIMIHYPGQQTRKPNVCFAVHTIYYHCFLGNPLQCYQDNLEDSPQGIGIDLPLGFVGMT